MKTIKQVVHFDAKPKEVYECQYYWEPMKAYFKKGARIGDD